MRDTRADRIREAIRLAVEEYDRRMQRRERIREAQRKRDLRRERNSWLCSLALVGLLSFAGGRWSGPSGDRGETRIIRVDSARQQASEAAFLARRLRDGDLP